MVACFNSFNSCPVKPERAATSAHLSLMVCVISSFMAAASPEVRLNCSGSLNALRIVLFLPSLPTTISFRQYLL